MNPPAPLDLDEALSAEHPRYEPRPDQARMARDVGTCLARGGVLLAEAPTGLGKTLAYLVPAIEWARENGKPVLIATHTRNLQDQIFDIELPIASRALGGEVRAVRLKGRENYLCKARAEGYIAEFAGTPQALKMLEIVGDIVDGDLGSLFAADEDMPPGWEDLHAGHCPPEICRNTRGCWLRQARRRAQDAHVVVANHALWLADRLAGGTLLPEFSRLVVDEAHHLPEAFTRAYSLRFSEHGFQLATDRLLGRPRAVGLLPSLRRAKDALPLFGVSSAVEVVEPAQRALDLARERGRAAFEALHSRLAGRGRIGMESESDPAALFPPQLDAFLDACRDALRQCIALRERASGEEAGEAARLWPYVARSLAQWEEVARALFELTGPVPAGHIASMEISRTQGVTLERVPWDVGRAARKELTANLESVVLTSATLCVDARFDYLCGRLGLEPGDAETRTYTSPLEPARQMRALTVASMPDPRDKDFAVAAADVVAALAPLGRNQMVLATSWDLLERMRASLEPRVGDLLVQGDPRGRSRLLHRLREGRGMTLLGVQSFWEGVDLPGEALELLVMVKLPFGVPGDPLAEARARDLESRGLDPFRDMSLPEAVLRFRQGAGRLLRRTSDRGVFVVLDRRIRIAGYGRSFAAAVGVPLTEAADPAAAAQLARQFLGD